MINIQCVSEKTSTFYWCESEKMRQNSKWLIMVIIELLPYIKHCMQTTFTEYSQQPCKVDCVCVCQGHTAAYGSSQARGRIRAVAASLHHSHSSAGSLTYQVGPGIKPASSWILVRFISPEPQRELHEVNFYYPCISREELSWGH